MKAIHLIERVNQVKKISETPSVWASGDWDISEEAASALIGADLYLHTAQDIPSHFGGLILGYRVLSTSPVGRIVFLFSPTMDHKNVRAGRDGWGNEQKRVQ